MAAATAKKAKGKAGAPAGISSAAVERATGKPWEEWLRVLDKAGARGWPHKEIAAYLHGSCGVGGWWSQMVTVGYEQARGMRQKHQVADGFRISGSKTVNVPVAALYRAWAEPRRRGRWLPGADLEVRRATRNKSMRMTWEPGRGATDVVANFYARGAGKSLVSVEHGKLASAAAGRRMKAFWGERLGAMKAGLEA